MTKDNEFKLRFSADNDAFHIDGVDAPVWEIAQILRDIAAKVEQLESGGNIYDTNGNLIGKWVWTT